MGRNDSEWGQMGVIMMAGTLGWIMEAPAAAAYAVLPVGVDTITPKDSSRVALRSPPRRDPQGTPARVDSIMPEDGCEVALHASPTPRGPAGCPGHSRCPPTIALHGGDEVPIQVDVHVGQVGGGASVNHHLVQDLGAARPPHTERGRAAPPAVSALQTALLPDSLGGSEDGGSPLGFNPSPPTLCPSPRP